LRGLITGIALMFKTDTMKSIKHPKAEIINHGPNAITVQIEIPISSSMLETEELIQQGLNAAGTLTTGYVLSMHDTDGSPLIMGNEKFTSKGLTKKEYECPYGTAVVARHVYQSNKGGSTFCPLDQKARIQRSSTPKFAKTVSWKYSNFASGTVAEDLAENHGRSISNKFIQDLGQHMATNIEAKSSVWHYDIPVDKKYVKSISASLDGTCLLMVEEGYRQAMVGSISLYDKEGERLYTFYVASAPEYGKQAFYEKLEVKIAEVKKLYPQATWAGIADGAKDNWSFLTPHVNYEILDFYHVTEYLGKFADATIKDVFQKKKWMEETCHKLKHDEKGAKKILKEMKRKEPFKNRQDLKDDISSTITYFENHIDQMDYAKYQRENLPIGSGIIESACKVIIKQRLGNSGMKWKNEGAQAVMNLRCLSRSDTVWNQVWEKIDRYGFQN